MSRCYAEITFPESAIEDFPEILGLLIAEDLELDCETIYPANKDLVTYTNQESYGEFEKLEKYLYENRIPFDRDTEAWDGYCACTRFFRPSYEENEKSDITLFYDSDEALIPKDWADSFYEDVKKNNYSIKEIMEIIEDFHKEYAPIDLGEYVEKYFL